jgi:hypothetical protein
MMRLRCALFGLAASLVACGANPYYGTATVTDQGGDPMAVINPNSAIEMTEGSAANADIVLNSQTGGTMTGDIQSKDPDTLAILHAPRNGNIYVFLAKKAGLAEVVILTNGVEVRSIYATVTPPPGVTESADAGPDGGDAGEGGSASDARDGGDVSDAGDAATEE